MNANTDEMCKGCEHLGLYRDAKYDDHVCTHPDATYTGHSEATGKPQPVYVAATVFFNCNCKGNLKKVPINGAA